MLHRHLLIAVDFRQDPNQTRVFNHVGYQFCCSRVFFKILLDEKDFFMLPESDKNNLIALIRSIINRDGPAPIEELC